MGLVGIRFLSHISQLEHQQNLMKLNTKDSILRKNLFRKFGNFYSQDNILKNSIGEVFCLGLFFALWGG